MVFQKTEADPSDAAAHLAQIKTGYATSLVGVHSTISSAGLTSV